MVILKTDLPADAMTVEERKAKEDAVGKVIGEIEEFLQNVTRRLSLILRRGAMSSSVRLWRAARPRVVIRRECGLSQGF